ncbi:MAG: hypothetical protein AAGN46_04955 [Acidobacteriota bacterium]
MSPVEAAGGYRIVDEPRPGALAQVAVDPLWPLLAMMLAGVWLAWPWFVLNGLAVGSPTRRREAVWAVLGLVGAFALLLAIAWSDGQGLLPAPWDQVAVLAVVVWKLFVSYRLYVLQARSFGLYEYFGGTRRNGLAVVVVAFLVAPAILGALPDFFAAWLR